MVLCKTALQYAIRLSARQESCKELRPVRPCLTPQAGERVSDVSALCCRGVLICHICA